jgi:transposase
MTLPGRVLSPIAPLLAGRRQLHTPLAYFDEVIERVTSGDARGRRLRTVPSVGLVTAAAFVPFIVEVQCFRHAHQVQALVPRELSLGEIQRRGHMLTELDENDPHESPKTL